MSRKTGGGSGHTPEVLKALVRARKSPVKVNTERDKRPAPASYNQERLWPLVYRNAEANSAFNIQVVVEILGPLHHVALKSSLDTIVERHESLRTYLHFENGHLHQKPAIPPHCETIEFRANNTADDTAGRALQEIVKNEAYRPFDLTSRQALFRSTLLCVDADRHILILVAYHLICDGWSIGRLCEELSESYESHLIGQLIETKEADIQYSDFASWERNWICSRDARSGIDYWLNQITTHSKTDETKKRRKQTESSYRGARHNFSINNEMADKLAGLAGREQCSLSTIILLAFTCVLNSKYEVKHQTIGVVMANRIRREIQKTIGYFSVTLPLYLRIHPISELGDALMEVQNTVNNAFHFQDVPLGAVLQEAERRDIIGISAPFRFMYVYNNHPSAPMQLRDLQVQWFDFDRKISKKDLSLLVKLINDKIECSFEYSISAFEEKDIEKMAKRLELTLLTFASYDDLTIEDLLRIVASKA